MLISIPNQVNVNTGDALDDIRDRLDALEAVGQPEFNVSTYGTIQGAIDAADAAGGGIVRIQPGIYYETVALMIVDADNVHLRGSGIGVTIIDFSGTANPSAGTYTNPASAYGCITVDTSTAATTIKNIHLSDFTLKTSTAAGATPKGIFLGAVEDCVIERIKVDGCVNETINLIDARNSSPKYAKNFTVRNCEFTNIASNAVDSNSTGLIGQVVTDNNIHDCTGGAIMLRGIDIICSRNRLYNIGHIGIMAVTETTPDFYTQNMLISENILDGVGANYATNLIRYGIRVKSSSQYVDGALMVANNIISRGYESASYGFTGISVSGNVSVKNNIFRGLGNNGIGKATAIQCEADPFTGTNIALQLVEGNVLEPAASGYQWLNGITVLTSSAQHQAIVRNNVVMFGALVATTLQRCFTDGSGFAVVYNNIFQDTFTQKGVSYNASGQMSADVWSSADTVFIVFSENSATPSVLGGKRFKTHNTSATTITDLLGGYIGKEIWIWVADANTTIDLTGTHLFGNGNSNRVCALNDVIHAIDLDGTYWTLIFGAAA